MFIFGFDIVQEHFLEFGDLGGDHFINEPSDSSEDNNNLLINRDRDVLFLFQKLS